MKTVDPVEVERRAQQRSKKKIRVKIGCRRPTDPINIARLVLWKERMREAGIQRHRMRA